MLAAAATVIGVALGAAAGIYAGYRRGLPDTIVMCAVDVLLAFPQLVFVLLLVSVVGPSDRLLVLAVGYRMHLRSPGCSARRRPTCPNATS